MWYERLLLCSATKETQLWFWVEHSTPWGWRLLYQPAGGQVLEPTPPISWVLPSGDWTCWGYVLHIFCSWDGNQDSSNIFVPVLQSLPKDLWKTRFGWKTACKCTVEAQNSCVVKPLDDGQVTEMLLEERRVSGSQKNQRSFKGAVHQRSTDMRKHYFLRRLVELVRTFNAWPNMVNILKCFAIRTAWVCPQKYVHQAVTNPCMDSTGSKPHLRAVLTLKQTPRGCRAHSIGVNKGYSCISVIVQH